jgi:O-acetyl-ADP-ribose deacetylase (regulator of RNase III)
MTARTFGAATLELRLGDITRQAADAIVNAANSRLAGGGGVDGAIHRAGGPTIMEECRRIGGCPTGETVITTAGRLPAKWVFHAVGPIYRDGQHGEPDLLASVYRSALDRADELGARTIALPSISTGAYGYPLAEAAAIALRTTASHLASPKTGIRKATFVLFDGRTLAAYERALAELTLA